MPELSTVTDPNLPEPKGVAAATVSQVYVSDGAGSGEWTDSLDKVSLRMEGAETAQTIYIPIDDSVTVTAVRTAIQGSVGTADEVLTVRNNAGASMGTITITQSGSAAGDVDLLEPVSNNTLVAGETLRIESAGDSSSSLDIMISVSLRRT
jgi:hypothetical protein